MPIISDKMKKEAKKEEKREKKQKEEEEHRKREEEAKKEQEEREAKEREEQEKRQKKLEKRQKGKEVHNRHKREKQELERKANMRREMALIRKMGPKVTDEKTLEVYFEGKDIEILSEVKTGSCHYSTVYKAKMADNDNIVCKVVILEKLPPNYRQNLVQTSLQIMRYIGGGTNETNTSNVSTEAKNGGLVKVHDIYLTNKKAYIFMDEVNPKSFIEALLQPKPPNTDIQKVMKQLAKTLQYLHSIGVSHNNLRSSHVLTQKDNQNQIKVVGFGMSSFYWDSDIETVIPQKRLHKKDFEKNSHLPPEVFKDETFNPVLADIWSLGVLMVLMITKENPFKLKNEQTFEDQWRSFAQTKQFSDEAKQFLDRIFVEPSKRPNITDLLEESYLSDSPLPPRPDEKEKKISVEKGGSQDKD